MSDKILPATDEQVEDFDDGCEIERKGMGWACTGCRAWWPDNLNVSMVHESACRSLVWPKIKARISADRETIRAKDALIAELVAALGGLVEINTKWNVTVEKTIGRPPNWTDGYLDMARAVLAKAKEAGQ